MRTVREAKEYLRQTADWRRRLEAAHRAGDSVERLGIDRAKIEDEEIRKAAEKVTEAVQMMLRLPPDEAQVLIARYVDGQPYETLHEHEYLKGMCDRQSWRLLARATERFAEVMS